MDLLRSCSPFLGQGYISSQHSSPTQTHKKAAPCCRTPRQQFMLQTPGYLGTHWCTSQLPLWEQATVGLPVTTAARGLQERQEVANSPRAARAGVPCCSGVLLHPLTLTASSYRRLVSWRKDAAGQSRLCSPWLAASSHFSNTSWLVKAIFACFLVKAQTVLLLS